jgi:hypothetical protein
LRNLPSILLLFVLGFARIEGYSIVPDSTDNARMELLFELPSEISESSGLIFFQNEFWTFNDSGGEPVLFAIDIVTGKILRRISISNASNIDWEEVTQDDEYIYIGDFGNNYGNRKDLKIYRITKSELLTEKTDLAIKADIISFRFADQMEYQKNLFTTRYDCEAMIIWGDSIVIFSKNWKDETSTVYCIPKLPGIYEPSPAFVFQSRGLVTGAALSKSKKELIIVGYEDFTPFIWLIQMEKSIDFRRNVKSRKTFILMSGVQTEGVCFGPGGYLYISCERSLVKQSIFRLNPARLRKSH